MHTGGFYYSLSNLRPALHSVLQSIQLVAVVKTSFVDKYGIDVTLKPFMEDICNLENVKMHLIKHWTHFEDVYSKFSVQHMWKF